MEFKCHKCINAYTTNRALSNHIRKKYGEEPDFALWKDQLKEKENVSYVVFGSAKNDSISYYHCNRSCQSRKRDKNRENKVRQPRSQGRRRLAYKCISHIMVNKKEGTVVWVKSHYGHTMDLEHLPLPKSDRRAIAEKLLAGVRPKMILKSVAEGMTSVPKRLDILTSKDLDNIKNSFRKVRDGCKRHEIEQTPLPASSALNVQEMDDNNPIQNVEKPRKNHTLLDFKRLCQSTLDSAMNLQTHDPELINELMVNLSDLKAILNIPRVVDSE